jgi:hypothetical protein
MAGVLVVPCAGVLVCMKLSRNSLLLRSRCFAIKLETPLARYQHTYTT